jgi:hypothetical protein
MVKGEWLKNACLGGWSMVGFHWGSSVHRFLGYVFPRFPPSKLQISDIENGVSEFEQMNIENHKKLTRKSFYWFIESPPIAFQTFCKPHMS